MIAAALETLRLSINLSFFIFTLTLKSQLSNINFFIPLFSEPNTTAFFKSFGTELISISDLLSNPTIQKLFFLKNQLFC